MKIGMLTGGGDCPGLNAVIRAVVRKGTFHYKDQFIGFIEGPQEAPEVAGRRPAGGNEGENLRHNPAMDICDWRAGASGKQGAGIEAKRG